MVAAFLVAGSVANVVLFGLDPLGSMNMLNAVGLVLAVAAILTRQRPARSTITVLYGVYLAAYLWIFAPRSY